MTHDKERHGLVSFLDEVDRLVGDQVRHISPFHFRPFVCDESRIKVLPLTRYHVPIVKTSRLVCLALSEMPLAYHSRLVVAVRLELLCDVWHPVVNL